MTDVIRTERESGGILKRAVSRENVEMVRELLGAFAKRDHALICNQRQWGRRSGIETVMPPYGLVFTIRNGKVVRWRGFNDQESALKAAGLSGNGGD